MLSGDHLVTTVLESAGSVGAENNRSGQNKNWRLGLAKFPKSKGEVLANGTARPPGGHQRALPFR